MHTPSGKTTFAFIIRLIRRSRSRSSIRTGNRDASAARRRCDTPEPGFFGLPALGRAPPRMHRSKVSCSILGARREYEEALVVLDDAADLAAEVSARTLTAVVLASRGRALEELGRLDAARWSYARALEVNRRIPNRSRTLSNLDDLVRVAALRGDTEAAAELEAIRAELLAR